MTFLAFSRYIIEEPIPITWYAFCILSGIVLASFLGIREGVRLGLKKNDILDGLLYCLPFAIIGTRLYYVIFNFEYFGFDFLKIIGYDRDEGRFALEGLAIHGGIIAVGIFVFFYTKRKGMSLWKTLDILAPSFLIGQILGRWGNFFNQEAHGTETTKEFLSKFLPNFIVEQMKIGGIYYHPTFLYESLWNLLGLTLIIILRRRKVFKLGDIFPIYLIWYGLGRGLLIEPLRTDPLMLNIFNLDLRVNIFSSLLFCVIGAVLLILKRKKWPNEKYYPEDICYSEALTVREDGRKHPYI